MISIDSEWPMNKQSLLELLKYPESTWLDWKADFPDGLIRGAKDPQWEKGKGTMLKDMVAIANSEDERNGCLAYGVIDDGGNRTVQGTSKVIFGDADLQQWVENAFDPPFIFSYGKVEWSPGQTVAIVCIEHSPSYPHVCRRNIGEVIHEGQVWYRRGSKNTVALHNELKVMFLGSEPMRVPSPDDPLLDPIREFYAKRDRETSFVLLARMDACLAKGHEIALVPGSRRKILLVNSSNEEESVLMLKRPQSNQQVKHK
ncbi:MAG: ATP-binding protein [Armatimonadetes bacterium]|nr:ATP-binding protein [Armatimonadota bacterium]